MKPEELALLKMVRAKTECNLSKSSLALRRVAYALMDEGMLSGTLRKTRITQKGVEAINAAS